MNDFYKFARGRGIGSARVDQYTSLLNSSSLISAEYISPMVAEEHQLNVSTMDVFSRLMVDRIIFMGCTINDDVANIIQAQLLFLEGQDPTRDITMYINSGGGYVHAGLGIYDTMQIVEPDVATVCTGMAASMAAVLLSAGSENKRSALKHSRVMIHQPLGGAQGQASDIEISARQIRKTKSELYEILSYHTGKSIEQIEADADRDFWLSSEEAKEYGLIDKVLSKRTRENSKDGKKK